jgi:hypothetical protein
LNTPFVAIINARFKISEESNCTAIFAYGRQPEIKKYVVPSEGGLVQFKTYFDISACDQLTLVPPAGVVR